MNYKHHYSKWTHCLIEIQSLNADTVVAIVIAGGGGPAIAIAGGRRPAIAIVVVSSIKLSVEPNMTNEKPYDTKDRNDMAESDKSPNQLTI